MPATSEGAADPGVDRLRAKLLGPFSISLGDRVPGPWDRPSARRLCQLVMVSPGLHISRQAAQDALFPNLGQQVATRELYKALSMARAALSVLGATGASLLAANRTHIWVDPACRVEIDFLLQADALRQALLAEAGTERDDLLVAALAEEGTLLEGEPVAEWAVRAREQLEWSRQEARQALARDRARGFGRSGPAAVVQAWEGCLAHDPTCEEAASALIRVYSAQGRASQAEATYRRCRSSLEQLGLCLTPALEAVHASAASAALPPPPPTIGSVPAAPVTAGEERRLVTVLFADLSGPAGFQRLDPEDVRDAVGEAVAGVIAIVELLGGTITSVSGAGLVALFGAPVSHEDDPERAVRAGYRIVTSLARKDNLPPRVGVETGPAVVGPIGRTAVTAYGAVGEVVGVAAALQSVAKRGSVLVGPATLAAVGPLFEWGPTEEVVTSPADKALVGRYLDRPKAGLSSQAARRRLGGAAPLVGRERELEVARESVRDLTAGKGGVFLVVAEPGLGKTRLVQECRKLFMAWVGATSGRLPLWLEGRAASYASSTPYGLYQQLVAGWAGVALEEREDIARRALERAMSAVFAGTASDDQVSLLAQIMGLGKGGTAPSLAALSPEQLQRATFVAVRDVVSRLVAHGPTVLVLEDLHWSDPTSLGLTEELSSLVSQGPLLLVLTRRPEPDPGASALESALGADETLNLRRVELEPLAPGAERELAQALLGGPAPDKVLEAVSMGSDGVPLFLEERLSSLLESRALVRDETGWRLDGSVPSQVPEALERLVRSRVDRLEPGPLAAIVAASVLGVEFGWQALCAMTDLHGDLAPAVSELCAAGLLNEVRKYPEAVYRFHHALVQDAVYKGLVREQRRRLHARAAWGLETASTGRTEEVAAVLGHHYAEAGELDRAVHHWEQAGDHAAARFANNEAVASYRDALDLINRGTSGRNDLGRPVALRFKLGQVLLLTGRRAEAREVVHEALRSIGADERAEAARLQALLGRVELADHQYDAAMAAFDAAEELLGGNMVVRDQATVDLWLEVELDGRAWVLYWRNEPEKGGAVLAAARPVVEARGTPARKQSFFWMYGGHRMRQTRYRIDEETLTSLRAAVAAAREAGDEQVTGLPLFTLGFALVWHGDLAAGREDMEAALAIADRTGDVVLRARCLCYLTVAALREHDTEAVRALAPNALEAATTAGYPEYVAAAKAMMAWVAWRDGRPDDVLALGGEALELWRTTVVSYSWYWLCLWPLVSVRLEKQDLAGAVEAARQLLPAPQQRLPDELEANVQAAIAAWDGADASGAAESLSGAVELARRLNYA